LRRALRLFLFPLCVLAVGSASALAQASPTATRRLDPAVFVGATGVYTGLGSGRNLSITTGFDLAFLPVRGFIPALEYRGMYAVDNGHVDSLKNSLGGLKLSSGHGRLYVYADLLAGRGETTYASGGYQVPGKIIFYTKSSANVFSFGGGTDVFLTDHFALKVDLQAQHYSSPVTSSGALYSKTGTIGLVYAFRFRNKAR
jgi:hypothetical protein